MPATACSVVTGYIWLDGGAMFGVVPKVLWEKLTPPDERNRIRLAMRSLLFRSATDGEWCLVDCGAGNKWDAKRRDIYGLESGEVESLVRSLAAYGLSPEDIRYMFVSHLHFDHNGGLTSLDPQGKVVPTFPQAKHFIHRKHWEHAQHPHERDCASFFLEDYQSLPGQVDIHWVEKDRDEFLQSKQGQQGQVRSYCVHGHTPYLMVFDIALVGSPVRLTYASDMVPTASHIRIPYVMGYDLQPAVLIDEKKKIYERLSNHPNAYLFLEHDEKQECVQVQLGQKGWSVVRTCSLKDLVSP